MASMRGIWEERLSTEIDFWKDWMATKGGPRWSGEFLYRMDPESEIEPGLASLINSPDDKIIDVGAGPLTLVGKLWKGHRMGVTAVDPLAHEYDKLMDGFGIVPPLRTVKADAVNLSKVFPENSFDIAFARNCLDHSYDAPEAVRQMVRVVKPGGTVFLRHGVKEGEGSGYTGLHQWNFHTDGNDFFISSPGFLVNM